MLRIKKLIFLWVNRMLRLVYPIRIMGAEDSIRYIEKNQASLCRFGEGEIGLLARKQNLKFQKYDEALAQRMKEILSSSSKGIEIAIPSAIKSLKNLNSRASKFWYSDTAYSMIDWVKYTSFGKRYLDALMTRCYIDLKDRSRTPELYALWKKIWRNRRILIIEGEESRLGIGNDLFSEAVEIKRILCPSVNAFDVYDRILCVAQQQSKEYLVLIALGPTASVLAYDLAVSGFQALDVGHIDIEYEWFKMNVDVPTKVPGKFTNEAKNGNLVENNNDSAYLSQIIAKIKS